MAFRTVILFVWIHDLLNKQTNTKKVQNTISWKVIQFLILLLFQYQSFPIHHQQQSLLTQTSLGFFSKPSATLFIISLHWLLRCLHNFWNFATSCRRRSTSLGSIVSPLLINNNPKSAYPCKTANFSSSCLFSSENFAIPLSNSSSLIDEFNSCISTINERH